MATDKHNLIVYCEFEDGKVADVSLELLTKGRQLADKLGIKLEAVVAGDNLKEVEKQILPYGVDTVYKFEDKRLSPYTSLPHSSILINLFREKEPRIAFMGATSIGRDLGPRVSSALHSGLTADCTQLEIGDHKDARTGQEYKDLLLQIRPAFGGNIVATIVNPDCRPQMATVREGVMKKEMRDSNYSGKVVDLKASDYTCPEDFAVAIIDRHVEKSKVNLKGSPIIVAGGYGVGSKENFDLLQQLADTLGAEVGASRAAVDAGWVDHDRQIGRRRRFHGTRPSGRTDRSDRASEALYRLRYLRPDPAYRRHAGLLADHLHQQRPRRSHQRYRRCSNHRQDGGCRA